MLNQTQFFGSTPAGGPGSSTSGTGALADTLLRQNQTPFGLDIGNLARDLGTLGQGGSNVAQLVTARLTPVEQGQLAGATNPADAALDAGGAGRSPEQTRQIGEAFRRELDGAPATAPASASPAAKASYTDLKRAGELALLNSDVYLDTSNPALLPKGYTALSDSQAQSQFPGFTARDDTSGFYSRIYRDSNTNTYVVVNRGTNDASAPIGILKGTPDGKTNSALIRGQTTRQATLALDNANFVVKGTSDRVLFSGHSLGGGLASLQALATNKQAVVFNPLGINPGTAKRYNLDIGRLDTNVRSYKVDGEPVAKANSILGLRTSSQTTVLASRELNWSANDGFQATNGSKDPHSMVAVMAGILNGMVQAKTGAR